jgi:hypothetical protein
MVSKERLLVSTVVARVNIENNIFSLRGHRVMLDRDLAELYGVSLKRLNEQVGRNKNRFPKDFMFQLTLAEGRSIFSLRSQFATLKRGQHLKYAPYVFTEHGAVMLANVLKSDTAVRASIQVVRAFVHLRRSITNQELIARHLELLERKVGKHDSELKTILEILRKLLDPLPPPSKRPMGFLSGKER